MVWYDDNFTTTHLVINTTTVYSSHSQYTLNINKYICSSVKECLHQESNLGHPNSGADMLPLHHRGSPTQRATNTNYITLSTTCICSIPYDINNHLLVSNVQRFELGKPPVSRVSIQHPRQLDGVTQSTAQGLLEREDQAHGCVMSHTYISQ